MRAVVRILCAGALASVPACGLVTGVGDLSRANDDAGGAATDGSVSLDGSGGGSEGGADARGGEDVAPIIDAAKDVDATTLASNLVAHVPFDEAAGTIASDVTGHGHDATLTQASWMPAGHSGAAIILGSDTSVAQLANLTGPSFPQQGATVSFWVRGSTDVLAQYAVFDDWDSMRSHVFIRTSSAVKDAFQVALQPGDGTGNYVWVNDFTTVDIKAWNHLVLSWGAGVVRTATNGAVQEYAYSPKTFAPSAQSARLGGGCRCAIDELSIYDRLLTPAEIVALP